MSVLLAVMERRVGLVLGDRDVTLNVVGGLSLREPATDLAVACAIASAAREVPILAGRVVFGEVGLAGELRAVPRPEMRLREARQLGFSQALLPAANAEQLTPLEGVELVPVRWVGEALEALLG